MCKICTLPGRTSRCGSIALMSSFPSDTGVKSIQGTRFRQWATSAQREHLVRGYTLSSQRLEQNSRELESQNEQLLVGVLWESVVLSSASS